MGKNQLDYNEWVAEVGKLLDSQYGITVEDCADDDRLRSSFSQDETPQEFVSWIGEKYDLRTWDL